MDLPEVEGAHCLISLYEFKRRAKVLMAEEMEKPLPNNALIDFLCNAVRLAREVKRKQEIDARTVLELQKALNRGGT